MTVRKASANALIAVVREESRCPERVFAAILAWNSGEARAWRRVLLVASAATFAAGVLAGAALL